MATYSILRTKEDKKLSELVLRGRTIDLGGHKGSSYFSSLVANSEHPIEVANFDSVHEGTHKTSSGADHVFDFEKPFPLPDGSFDNVICVNVLEHIYDYRNLVRESHRILKSGGKMYLSIPFFFNIHGSPDDYFRYTRSALVRIFNEAGFSDVTITELGDGPVSVLFQTFGGSIPTMTLKLCMKRIAMATDTFFSKVSKRYASIKNRVPLGYFVSVRKG